MYGFIYLTTNKINGKKYIGMCKNTHRNGYLGSGMLLKKAIRKYGKENFERIVLEECETLERLSKAEEHWIKFYNAVESDEFYNLTTGGFGGNSDYLKEYWSSFSEEERKLCRNWSRKNMSGENNPMFGKKHSEETRRKIGAKSVNRNWKKPNHFGSNNPKAKKVLIEQDSTLKYFDCLKDYHDENKSIPYSTLKNLAQTGRISKKYGIKITYV